MTTVQIQRNNKEVDLPVYAHEGDAGFDLRAAEEIIIKPGELGLIKTGLHLAIPQGHVGLIWDRSGLAAKHQLHTFAGVIDSGYRGEISVVIKNFSDQAFQVTKHMRIAQMIIQPVVHATVQEVESLAETMRSGNGFGSTGLH
ncbi:dUTP diphosphatase [Candidatus Woesearchaeota archaeon]|nr:dUTP diphosphatase [Candidatus Woesearchaeota archaeon]